MNTSTKILDILIQELGAKTVAQQTGLKVFSKQDIIDAITHISTKSTSLNEGSSTEEIRADFIRLLIAHLFPEDPSVATLPTVPATPAPTSVAKPPPVIKRGEKVIIKKKTDPVVKKLEPELEAVKEEPRYEAIIPAPAPPAPSVAKEQQQGDEWLCGACNLPAGNDHRPCICSTYNFSVQAWEDARIFPKTQNKVIKVMKKVVKAAGKPVAPPTPAPAAVVEAPVAVVKTTVEEAKKPGRPKKAVKELPRCDSRIYGEKVEMEGTKAPNGGPLHCFKPAQCERKGPEKIAVNEENVMRHLTEDEEPAEDEGVQRLCKVCVKRWEARAEKAADWHGFFDDDVAPDTSHFEGGSWYQKKMAAIKKEQ
jgi:hypothetical protein